MTQHFVLQNDTKALLINPCIIHQQQCVGERDAFGCKRSAATRVSRSVHFKQQKHTSERTIEKT
jgi:hypothetical protein